MVDREERYTLNCTMDQHEAILGMKRGKDTVYTVLDRLIENEQRIGDLERRTELLDSALAMLNNVVYDLKNVMVGEQK